MTQDFYLNALALHEEFQKRELHYLNTERKLNSSIMGKKDFNLPLQEYLERINQREKETEETYRNIMKQMEELHQHTDVMSLKLEKLGILQTSVTTATIPKWVQKLDSNMGYNHQAYGTHSLYIAPNILPLSVKSVSTQTESSLHCEKCKYIMTNNQSSHLLENLLPSASTHFGMNDKTETIQSSNSQCNSNGLLNGTRNISQYIESKDNEHLLMPVNHNFIQENSKIEKVNVESQEHMQEHAFRMELDEGRNNLFKNQLHVNEVSIAENTQCQVSKNEGKLTGSQSIANEKYDEIQEADAQSTMDTFVSKSNLENMNNEFDFLESDITNATFKIETQKTSRNIKFPTEHTSVSLDKAPTSAEKHFSEPKLNFKSVEQQKSANSDSKFNADDDKSETSGSASGFHSPNVSVASDSDSIYEKGSLLTASTAYQALLGYSLPKKMPKNVSDSESEDDVENVLASAVQRSHVKYKSSVKQRKDETSFQLADTKPVDKPSKLSSGNKPQSKLSRNTRKVLGLDTSSGSEVEMAVKPPSGEKIDEDSDEFAFFN